MCLIEIIDSILILCFLEYYVIMVGKTQKHPIDFPHCMRTSNILGVGTQRCTLFPDVCHNVHLIYI